MHVINYILSNTAMHMINYSLSNNAMHVINYSLSNTDWNLNICQMRYIEQTGLRTFVELPSIEVDHNFLTALIKRWRRRPIPST